MTSVLSCVVATIALAADPGLQGLPFGLPPAPDDAVIAHVAPPHCLFYLNWAGTASPSAGSSSETEKLLAEPEVQDFLNSLKRVIVAYLQKADETAKETAAVAGQTLPSPFYLHDDVEKFPVGPLSPPETAATAPAKAPDAAPSQLPIPAEPFPADSPSTKGPEQFLKPAQGPTGAGSSAQGPPVKAAPEKPKFNVAAQDVGDCLNVLMTHPTAIFVEDVKITPAKPAEKKADKKPSGEKPPEAKTPQASASPDVAVQAGMVVSLGPDAARLHAKFIKYFKKAKQSGADSGLEQIKIAGKTWYRSKPTKPGDENLVTFGFHGRYFVVGVGSGVVEGMLARWNRPAPDWLAKALKETQVPRRTGIVYLNLKALRDKLLPLAPSKQEAAAVLELLGLSNVDSLVSTTGLEDYGMINRVHLALDGKPRGLLDMVADRPLTAKDLEPIPSNALFAAAARADLDRTLKVSLAAYKQAVAATGNADARKPVEEFEKTYGAELHRFLSALGDVWCVYNSPAEGEMAFVGWTAVVSVRDRAALLDSWEKLSAALKKATDGKGLDLTNSPVEFCKCRFAGHEIHYLAGTAIAPAMCISDREVVMTLNMPAMKAYLTRRDHRSLATLPGVALALNDKNRPVALGYCNMPELFDSIYPWCSLFATALAGAAHQAKVDLDPTFWPSAPSIRRHLRPDITTVERTPNGLQLTCRYSLPTGGVNLPFCLLALAAMGSSSNTAVPFPAPVDLGTPGELLQVVPDTERSGPTFLPPATSDGSGASSGGAPGGTATGPSSTLSGKLFLNSADRNGAAPYVLLDRWGVVCGYVAAAQGVDLESCVGRQVSLQGTVQTSPGGDVPNMTCQRVLGGKAETANTHGQPAMAPAAK
jgi:hypothetical protein